MPELEEFRPVTLAGRAVRLEPLAMEHHDDLVAAARDGELWRLWYTSAPEPQNMQTEIARRLALPDMIPFAVIECASGRAVGMTTYMHIDPGNRRVEIGSTWYARSVQRTALNTEAKLLLLEHAFERLGCIAVEFRTHFLNRQSRRAIERLGAKMDGVLRSHSFAKDGTIRDTCVYSIVAGEWPAVRAHLRWMLERQR